MSEVKLFQPSELDADQWRQLQEVAMVACTAAFREGFDPEAYVDWNDRERFIESHLDPNSEVGRRYNFNQEYHHPRVAVAFDAGDPVSWGYSVRNVSGGGPAAGPQNDSLPAKGNRFAKRLSGAIPLSRGPVRNRDYLHFREDYTLPHHQNQGEAKKVAKRLLLDAIPYQPVAAYVYPEIYKPEMAPPEKTLKQLGFWVTDNGHGKDPKVVSGLGPVRQERWQARTAFGVWRKLGK